MDYSIAKLQEITTIPESTIRNYRDTYPDYFKPLNESGRPKYGEDTLEALKTIRECVDKKLSVPEIKIELDKKFGPEIHDSFESATKPKNRKKTATKPQAIRTDENYTEDENPQGGIVAVSQETSVAPTIRTESASATTIAQVQSFFAALADATTKKEPSFIQLKDAHEYLGISKGAMKTLSKMPGFPKIVISTRNILIPVEALKDWMYEESKKATR